MSRALQFALFFMVFFSVYFLLHFYVFHRISGLLGIKRNLQLFGPQNVGFRRAWQEILKGKEGGP